MRRAAVEASPFPPWPRVDRTGARVERLLLGRFDAAALGAVGVEIASALQASVRLLPRSIDASSTDDAVSADRLPVSLRFSHATRGKAELLLDGALAVAVVARLLGVVEAAAPRLLSSAERGVLGYLALRGVAVAPGWRVQSVSQRAPGRRESEARLEIEVSLGRETHVAWLVMDEASLQRLPPAPVRWDRIGRLQQVCVEVAVAAGAAWLTHAQVASLRPTDVVLLDATEGELRMGKGAFSVEIGKKESRVVGCFEHLGERMDKPKNEVVESIPVELVAEIGRLSLTGKELLELEPGAVLPLGRSTSAVVELTSAGKTVARGELVDLEGETGVRLTEILV